MPIEYKKEGRIAIFTLNSPGSIERYGPDKCQGVKSGFN